MTDNAAGEQLARLRPGALLRHLNACFAEPVVLFPKRQARWQRRQGAIAALQPFQSLHSFIHSLRNPGIFSHNQTWNLINSLASCSM